MWSLQSSLFAASQGMSVLAIIAGIAALAMAVLKLMKDYDRQKTRISWTMVGMVIGISFCLFLAKILLVSASNRALKSDVLTLNKDLDKFLKDRETLQAQQQDETPFHWTNRTMKEDRETHQLYHEQFDAKVKYAREQLAMRDIHDDDLDHFLAEDPSSPYTLDLLNARLEVMSRKL